jgi:predicted MFS family arabinose efflux permease
MLRAGGGMANSLVLLFSVAAGLAVSNIYFAQPLLTAIARDFHVGSGTASLVVTVTTAGYAVGLVLVVPLGDMLSRRKLIVCLLAAVTVLQAVCALTPSIGLLTVASAVAAVTAVVAPILVSFAATLADDGQRGRVTGQVMSGVLVGVLLARTGSGLVAQWTGGWRPVYVTVAVIMLALTGIMYRALPEVAAGERLSYGQLLRSAARIVREEPVVRLRCAYGFLCFAGFSAFWASSAFLLTSAPYHYNEATVGLFGLLGAVGAYSARLAGRLLDKGRQQVITGALLVVILAAWGVMALDDGGLLAALVVGVVVLDLGVQGVHVANLSEVYRLRPEARNRITMVYTGTYFLGGSAGAAASGVTYAGHGWPGVCLVGAVFALAGVLTFITVAVRRARPRSTPTATSGTNASNE